MVNEPTLKSNYFEEYFSYGRQPSEHEQFDAITKKVIVFLVQILTVASQLSQEKFYFCTRSKERIDLSAHFSQSVIQK